MLRSPIVPVIESRLKKDETFVRRLEHWQRVLNGLVAEADQLRGGGGSRRSRYATGVGRGGVLDTVFESGRWLRPRSAHRLFAQPVGSHLKRQAAPVMSRMPSPQRRGACEGI